MDNTECSVDEKVVEIVKLVKRAFCVDITKINRGDIVQDLQRALVADFTVVGRLPTGDECWVMMEPDADEDREDPPPVETVFTNTLRELECMWQLRGMGR